MSLKKSLALLGILILLAVVLVACGGKPEPTVEPTAVVVAPTEEVMAKPVVEIPYQSEWEGSGHNDVAGEPFRHWDDAAENPDGVPTSCAKCHSTAGYLDYVGADGSEALKVDAAVPAADAQGVQCVACHNPVTTFQMTSVAFPGFELDEAGEPKPFVVEGLGDSARCMVCHQGRESKASVDAQIARFEIKDVDAVVAPIKDDKGNDVKFGFRNVHYYAAAATLYGTEVKGGYEYEGKSYDGKFRHVEGIDSCVGCHNPHTLEVQVDTCAHCHEGVATVEDLKNVRMVSSASDYDGDGDVAEGVAAEIEGLQAILLTQIEEYAKTKAGAEIKYDAVTYPYFMGADGKAYPNWTARLLKAAYNYQVSIKDPGQFAHGGKYIIQLLHDSIEDLGGDVSKLAREDAGHFAGNTEAFRHWDGAEEGNGTVPFGCVKCHTATGLPTYIKDGGSTVVTGNGSTAITGLSPMPASNGFMCSTCHDEANWPNRYTTASVVFPSGKSVSFGGKDADGKFVADDSNLCLQCHQGRESTTSMNNALRGKDLDTVDAGVRFKNIHYFAAGATVFGGDVLGAYQYEGKEYVGQNLHASETGKLNKCADCHDVHALEPKVEACEACHDTKDTAVIRETTVDYDGDGDVTEGIKGEVDTLAEALYAQLKVYTAANGGEVSYNPAAYPYFFGADGKGYATWTPRSVKAAFNYQYVQKDTGAYVHNPKYVVQILIDAIADLGGDVSKYTRP